MQKTYLALLATSIFTLSLNAAESRNGDPEAYLKALIGDKKEMVISSEILCSIHIEMKAFTKLLETNTTLKKLKIAGTHIGNGGALLFTAMLQKNNTLIELDLSVDDISTLLREALADSLALNYSIIDVYYLNRPLGRYIPDELVPYLERNRKILRCKEGSPKAVLFALALNNENSVISALNAEIMLKNQVILFFIKVL